MQDDIKEIKQDVKELVKQGAVHNQLLLEHERRSIALETAQKELEAKIEPIQKHVNLVSILLKGLGAISIGAVIQIIIRRLL
jgi:hypothetical protein